MSGRYSVHEGRLESLTVCTLRDDEARSEARIVASVGANCYAWSAVAGGRRIDVIESPPDLETLSQRPSAFGTPILFPFPNRVRGGRFAFEGRSCCMDAAFGGNAIHGFVHGRPWNVAKTGTEDAASVTLAFDSQDHPDVVRQFPFPFRAEATYSLRGGELSLRFAGTNAGSSRMPAGYGIHPYFRAPLLPGGDPSACFVQVPVRQIWELKDLLPTGRLHPAEGDFDLFSGKTLGSAAFDAVFTDVARDPDGTFACLLRDRMAGAELAVVSDGPFREVVVYTPPGRASICFEPYTCTTDAFNLQPQGVDAGLIALEPDQALRGTVRMALRAL